MGGQVGGGCLLAGTKSIRFGRREAGDGGSGPLCSSHFCLFTFRPSLLFPCFCFFAFALLLLLQLWLLLKALGLVFCSRFFFFFQAFVVSTFAAPVYDTRSYPYLLNVLP